MQGICATAVLGNQNGREAVIAVTGINNSVTLYLGVPAGRFKRFYARVTLKFRAKLEQWIFQQRLEVI